MKSLILASLFVFSVSANAETPKAKKESKPPQAKAAVKADKEPAKPARNSASESLLPTHFKKGWKVEITDYDLKSDSFEIALSGEEEAGAFYFIPSEVLKGTGNGLDLKSFTLQKKKDMVGAEVILKDDMKIMTFEEYIQAGGDPETF